MNTHTNTVNSVDAKRTSSAKKGLKFTAEQLKRLHWIEGLSETEIGRRYGVSGAAIHWWVKKCGLVGRSKVASLLFEPSPALSYLLGCILGDGCVYLRSDGRYTVRFAVCDKIFAEEFAKTARLLGLGCNALTRVKATERGHRDRWLACFYSKEFGEWYDNLGMKGRLETALQFPSQFVRGFYESEGTIVRHRNGLEISMCDTHDNGSIIEAIKNVLPAGIEAKRYTFNSNSSDAPRYVIGLYRQLDVSRFLAWVMPCIKTSPRSETCSHANTEPIPDRNAGAGVENTKAVQNGERVGVRSATGETQPRARSKPRRCIPTSRETVRGRQKCSVPKTITFS